MGSMKVTVNLAMRARDVSRPRPEHLAEAEAREEQRHSITARNDAEIARVAGVRASSGAKGQPPSRSARPRRRRGR